MAHFYKYMSRDAARATLQNRTLRWSTSLVLNDPFDMQFAFQFGVNKDNVRALALKKSWDHVHGEPSGRPLNDLGRVIRQHKSALVGLSREEFDEEIGKGIDESFDNMKKKMSEFNATIMGQFKTDKILCLSELPSSILMWGYYAQNHAGLVLRFTDTVLNSPLLRAKQVRYVESIPSLFDDDMLSDLLAGYSVLNADYLIDEVALTKSKLWAHECEWRVYTGKGRTADAFEHVPFNAKELDGVIFGIRTAEADRKSFLELIREKYPHAQLLQAKPETITYSIIFEKIQ
jgi:Protein of unknown function (DUF2971)